MTYDNTDERGEDAVARQRGGSERPQHVDTCRVYNCYGCEEIVDESGHLTPDERAEIAAHDNKGFSEERCLRCGWVMGSPPLNCNNDDTPHRFPSHSLISRVTASEPGHLPECPSFLCRTPAFECCACHCSSLRACKARVTRSKERVIQEAEFNYDRGLNAARDAVAALTLPEPPDPTDPVQQSVLMGARLAREGDLAAIESLKATP